MFVFYHLDPIASAPSLMFSTDLDTNMLGHFCEHKGISSTDEIRHFEVQEREGEKYHLGSAKRDLCEYLLAQLADIPTNEHGVDGEVEQDFLHFPAGSYVYEIWHWFEKQFGHNALSSIRS